MYCIGQGIQYFAVTNGEVWEVYEPHRPVPIDEKLITSFSLRGSEHETVLKMLWLWHGNFVVGQPVVAEYPPGHKVEPTTVIDSEWVPLAEFSPPVGTPPPSEIRFPDETVLPLSGWHDLQAAVVRWLQETKKLSPSNCPVRSSRGGYLVNTEQVRRDGSRFLRPLQVGELWIETNRSARDHILAGRRIIKACGVDPTTVHVLPYSE
jgi:hypothetical protein